MKTDTQSKEEQDSFRDHIATVDQRGDRVWIYPQEAPEGQTYLKWRKILSYVQLLVLFGLPFLRIGGHPAIMLNFLERKFIFFGYVFWPQDLYLLAFALITFVVFVLFFTATFGRLFCGWLCPQTVFLEMVFRRIERAIEGTAVQQRRLDKQPMNKSKFFKKSLKHVIFYGISFIIGNIFLAYIIGTDQLWKIITDPPSQHLVGLSAMIIFSGVFYFVFSHFREQACVMVCPYGRLQSVLQDDDTITITYDFERGEPRGKVKKGEEAQKYGDCVDCHQCVAVCPTGIDIRNGLQLECVNCTACMDSCDAMMERLDRPKGLIRYASHNMIDNKQKKWKPSTRSIAYGILFLVLATISGYLIVNNPSVNTIISRFPGSLSMKVGQNQYGNIYSLHMLNKTFDARKFHLKLIDSQGEIRTNSPQIEIKGEEVYQSNIVIVLSEDDIKGHKTPLKIGIYEGDKLLYTVKTNFLFHPGMLKKNRSPSEKENK